MKHLAIKQYEKPQLQSNKLKQPIKTIFWHHLYVFTICSISVRLLLSSFHYYNTQNYLESFSIEPSYTFLFRCDASMGVLTTSVAYLRNAFILFCLSLVTVIPLTVQWLLSSKHNCLFFCQAYSLLVINSKNILACNRMLKYTVICNSPFREKWQKLKSYFKMLQSIWIGRLKLKFCWQKLPYFDATTCTSVVRMQTLMTGFCCEFLAFYHIFGTGSFTFLIHFSNFVFPFYFSSNYSWNLFSY